jgi:hypothetical protein
MRSVGQLSKVRAGVSITLQVMNPDPSGCWVIAGFDVSNLDRVNTAKKAGQYREPGGNDEQG